MTEKREIVAMFVKRLDLREIDERVLDLTSQPLPTSLATLDSIHLSTAMIYRAAHRNDGRILFATHDVALARAAKAMHFDVIGVTV